MDEGDAAVKRKGFVIRLVVCLLLLAAPCALADLSRGSRGEEVRQLQSMLIDLGFLEDQADGIFGKNTQAAVQSIQRYWGMDESGGRRRRRPQRSGNPLVIGRGVGV